MGAPGRPRKCHPQIGSLWMDIEGHKDEKVISILKQHGVDATDGEGRTAFINSIIRKNDRIFDWTFTNGTDINLKDKTGYTALHFAAYYNSFPIVKMLLENGADPNIQDIHGNIPLWTAMFNSQRKISEVIKLLLKYESNVNLNNKYGKNCKGMFKIFYNQDISDIGLSSE